MNMPRVEWIFGKGTLVKSFAVLMQMLKTHSQFIVAAVTVFEFAASSTGLHCR